MPHFNISEIQQSEVKTTSSHFNSVFVQEAPWNRFLTEERNALTLLQAFRKIAKVQKYIYARGQQDLSGSNS